VTSSVLFVCSGNICRSPTAEAVMAQLVEDAGLDDVILVESAGIGGWHAGDRPDRRATAEAARRGIAMRSRARQIHVGDFDRFDLVLAMDLSNQRDLQSLTRDPEHLAKVRLLRSFDPALGGRPDHELEVPDPYYGGDRGFVDVFDMVDAACRGLLDHLQSDAPK
jgi:protein-tyrosine phosphatase